MRRNLTKPGPWLLSALLLWTGTASAQDPPPWGIIADCAAGYLANWQNRLNDPERAPDMSTMVKDLSDEYKAAAVRFYIRELQSGESRALDAVSARMNAAIDRFIAMDKDGTLIPFLDACPQPYDEDDQ